MELAPCKGKSTETERVMFTFALTGRGVMGGVVTPRAPLRLPWAMEVIGLSARKGQQGYALPLSFQPAWVVRAIRYHGLFSPLRLTGMNRASHILGTRKIRLRSIGPEGHQKKN